MPPRVLILDSDSSAGLECIQSLGRLGATIHAAASQPCLAFRSRYANRTTLHPVTSDQLAAWISERHARHPYDLIVPATERSLIAFLTPEISQSARQRAVLPPAESLRLALDKESTRQFAANLGLRIPHTRMVTKDSTEPAQFPVVLKPIHSRRVRNGRVEGYAVTIARNVGEWRKALRNTYADIGVQEQEYVFGRGVGVEMLFDKGRPCWHFVHERLHEIPLTGGASSYRQSIAAAPEFVEPAERLLRALDWHGVAMVEFKLCADGTLYLVEINPRLWGSLALAIDSGVNFPVGLLAIASGSPVAPQPNYKIRYRTRNIATDLYWMRANLLADHSDPLLLTRPRLASFAEYARPLLGSESWDFFDARDTGIILRSLAAVFAELAQKVFAKALHSRRGYAGSRYHFHITQRPMLRRLKRRPRRNVLFLCYGNICRSPLAEVLSRTKMPGVNVSSAGFHDREGRSSPAFMHPVAARSGADLAAHRSRRVTARMIEDADIVVIMDRRNYVHMKEQFPGGLAKTVFLGTFANRPQVELEDPYGLPQDKAFAIGGKINECVERMALWMCK